MNTLKYDAHIIQLNIFLKVNPISENTKKLTKYDLNRILLYDIPHGWSNLSLLIRFYFNIKFYIYLKIFLNRWRPMR